MIASGQKTISKRNRSVLCQSSLLTSPTWLADSMIKQTESQDMPIEPQFLFVSWYMFPLRLSVLLINSHCHRSFPKPSQLSGSSNFLYGVIAFGWRFLDSQVWEKRGVLLWFSPNASLLTLVWSVMQCWFAFRTIDTLGFHRHHRESTNLCRAQLTPPESHRGKT